MLVGRPPFTGHPSAVMHQIGHDAPPPPSRLRPGLATESHAKRVDAVFARAFAKNPAHRFQSGEEFASALRTALTPRREPDWSWWGRLWTLAAKLGGALGGLRKPRVPAKWCWGWSSSA
jgi:serine/threonine protein kinase